MAVIGRGGKIIPGALQRVAAETADIPDLVAASGTADGTVSDVGAAFNQATLNNNFQELATKLNAVLQALRDAGVLV